jgi:uroporphyrinogen-III synthase
VTRAAHQASKLSEGLRAAGIEPVEAPVLEIQPPLSFAALDAALRAFDSYDWLIVTSANTVRALVERAEEIGVPLATADKLQIAAIGEATAKAVRKAGFDVAVVPENYMAESLAAVLTDRVTGKKILVARAEVARDVIPDALRAAGARVDVAEAYRNAMPADAPEQLRMVLGQGIDAATFTSSSSVTHLAAAARAAGIAFPFAGVKAVSIGPITSQTLREAGWEPAMEANPSDIPGLIAAVKAVL